MPRKKPTTSLRARPTGKAAAAAAEPKRTPKKAPTPAQKAKLRALGSQHERSPDAPGEPARTPGAVQRKGRLRADGTRSGARELRRLTVYLPPALVTRIEQTALERRETISSLIEEGLQAEYGP